MTYLLPPTHSLTLDATSPPLPPPLTSHPPTPFALPPLHPSPPPPLPPPPPTLISSECRSAEKRKSGIKTFFSLITADWGNDWAIKNNYERKARKFMKTRNVNLKGTYGALEGFKAVSGSNSLM